MRRTFQPYFSEKNIQNSYWAGFIAADGSVDSRRLRIELSTKDESQLERFLEDTGAETKITRRKRTRKGYNYVSETSYITICRLQWLDDLEENFKIHQNKTFTLEPPELNPKHELAYLVGFIDGDGWIMEHKIPGYSYLHLGVCSASIQMQDWLEQKFQALGETSEPLNRGGNKTAKSILLTGKAAVRAFRKLNQVPVRKMERKWGWVEGFLSEKSAFVHKNTALAKDWPSLIDPDGNLVEIPYGLTHFCNRHNMRPEHLKRLFRGERKTYKGWTLAR